MTSIECETRNRLRSSSGLKSCLILVLAAFLFQGCAAVRERAGDTNLMPCRDSEIRTRDGWLLGVRHYRPANPDPAKLPVVLCHGLGLNATFWTITDNHLPQQLTEAGYEVFVYDCRGSGDSTPENYRRLNRILRNTIIPERGERSWTTDDQAFYDIPAVLDHVRSVTGKEQVNWVGHSLGGMLMFTFLEIHPDRHRIANFVGMGSTAVVMPSRDALEMSRANRGLRTILSVVSTSRIARPMRFGRPPGLAYVDRFYYTRDNVDTRTVDRFYGYTLEDPGQAALLQLQPYLTEGRFKSADGTVDYSEQLDLITTPTLFIAGEGDVMADIPSKSWTFDRISSSDKTMLRFGKKHGHQLDYGHCDLVWARSAPQEIFPELIRWLDARQPSIASSQSAPSPQAVRNHFDSEHHADNNAREMLPLRVVIGDGRVKLR
ncbi:alpha/beta fold hydrolase [bacterium]|nr:alpha/beta fold hydrolase [bacterium]